MMSTQNGKTYNIRYPPGHGDLFESISASGMLSELQSQGIEYIFVSNIDNLGATIDPSIFAYVVESRSEFVMEVTDKTKADIKGGALCLYQNQLRLLELSQVPSEHRSEFMKRFKVFNTNNLWIKVDAIKRILSEDSLELDIIVNPKQIESTGEKILQLETAIGSAIRCVLIF